MSEAVTVPALRFPEFEGDWTRTELGQHCEIATGKLDANAMRPDGEYKFFTCAKEFYQIDHYAFDTEALLISGNGANVGYIHYCNGKFNAYQRTYVLDQFDLDIRFVERILEHGLRKRIYGEVKEGNMPYIVKATLSEMPLAVPSLPEQKKIAAFLGVVDAKLTALRDRVALLERYKRGLMQALFSQSLRFTKPDGTAFPDWEEKRLGEVADVVTGKTPSTTDDSLWNGDIMFVTPSDIEDGSKYQTSTSRMVLGDAPAKLVPKGAILYTCIASVGKMVIATEPCITNQQINAVVPKLNSEFVYYTLLCLTPRIKLLSANTTVPIINKTEFCLIKLPIPHPDEQQKIADALSAMDAKIAAVSDQVAQMEDFKKGLLQQMFV